MTTAEGQPPVDVADFNAKLAEHATLTGVPLDYLRFMICAQTAGALLPEGTALGGDAAMAIRLGPAAVREDPVLTVRAEKALPLERALLALARNLAAAHGGITASIDLASADDREMPGTISFSYRGEAWCKFGFELSPL